MWILKNSKVFLESITAAGISAYKSVTCWDFSTLYTTIDHEDLKHKINKLVSKMFPSDMFVCISDRSAFFSQKDYKGYIKLSCAQFIELFEFLIDNIYILFGKNVFTNECMNVKKG